MGQIIVTEISVNQQCENTNRIHIYIYILSNIKNIFSLLFSFYYHI